MAHVRTWSNSTNDILQYLFDVKGYDPSGPCQPFDHEKGSHPNSSFDDLLKVYFSLNVKSIPKVIDSEQMVYLKARWATRYRCKEL